MKSIHPPIRSADYCAEGHMIIIPICAFKKQDHIFTMYHQCWEQIHFMNIHQAVNGYSIFNILNERYDEEYSTTG